jgi:hypothetical protein
MKLSKISLALVALCAAAPSFAITAANYTNTSEFVGDTLNIRISGASAQDNGILGSALSLCVAGTVHKYSISNNAVYFCTPDIGAGAGQITVPAGKTKLAIYKYSVGGSAFGVAPINSNVAATGATIGSAGNQVPFLDLTKLNSVCTGTFATTTPAATFGTALSTYANVACSNASGTVTTLATTYIGVSDVEPAFFTNNASNITAATSYALIFGVPVSLNVRNAMQAQQGLVVGSDTEADMPSLSSAQITSAYTQFQQTWGGIGVTTGLVDDTIYVARRVDSSGTQKTFEALIARTPNGEAANKSCASGVDLFVGPDSGLVGTNTGDNESVCTAGTTVIFSGSGGGNVRNCMINHNAAGRGAIGMLTTEDKAGTANWRFVKVDGVAPTQANAASGKYRHYVESTINTRTAGAFATSAALGYTAVVNRLKADFANPATIKLINGADQPFGAAGLMALGVSGGTVDFTGASSVLPWTKLVSGTSLDNCQAPKVVF